MNRFRQIRFLLPETPCDRSVRIAAFVFLAALLFLGLFLFDDYGVTWDESDQRAYGEVVHDYVFKGDPALRSHRDRYHGPGFELLLVAGERALEMNDSRSIYLFRHLLTFLTFWLGIVAFYFLCRRYFRDSFYGLAGIVLLVLSPPIFAHGFFNSKDIPALSLFTLSMFTLLRLSDSPSLARASIHAVASALLMSVRVTGVLVPVLTIIVLLLGSGRGSRKWRAAGLYVLLWAVLTTALWPTLWENPIREFVNALLTMRAYPWTGMTFYMGRYFKGNAIPWHYTPVWIAISTPLLYTAAALLGTATSIASFFRRGGSRNDKLERIAIVTWFVAPVISVMALDSTLYDGWRHLFFVYPALLILALEGLRSAFRFLARLPAWVGTASRFGLATLCFVSLVSTAAFMVANHPVQQVYFSLPRSVVAGRFELDYWGASYRQALEKLLATDSDPVITIKVDNLAGALNLDILPLADRRRLKLVNRRGESKYLLTNMRYYYDFDYGYPEVFAIESGGIKILKVFRTGPPGGS